MTTATVLDQYPKQKYPDSDFTVPSDLAHFCFPCGLPISREYTMPEPHGFVLTQENGVNMYCACFIFQECHVKKIDKGT